MTDDDLGAHVVPSLSSVLAYAYYMAALAARLPIPGEHARRMLAAGLWYLYPGLPAGA